MPDYPLLKPYINKEYPTRYCFHNMMNKHFMNTPCKIHLLEVGLGFGDYSTYLLESMYALWGDQFTLDSVENWGGRMLRKNMNTVRDETLARFKAWDIFRCIEKDSLKAAEEFPDDFFHFIYIDANHRYKEVMEDLNAWWPKLMKGGIFSGHDYHSFRRDGVRRACYRFFTDIKRGDDVWVTEDVNPHKSWGITK